LIKRIWGTFDMEKCVDGFCFKGFYDGKVVPEKQWNDVSIRAEKRIDFYFKNIDAAELYGVDRPSRIIKFNFCPLCGKMFKR